MLNLTALYAAWKPPPPTSGVTNFNDLPFFRKDVCGTPLTVNCRFVFFTRADGTGTFPQGDPQTETILEEYVNRMNFRMANIRDPQGCAPAGWDYDYDSNVRFNVTFDYVADPEAWDYHARATAMGNYNALVHPFCPDNINTDDPLDSTWPHLRTVVRNYNSEHPNTFNLFFVEDGFLIKTLEHYLTSGTQPTGEYTDGFDIFSGCSDFPGSYYDPVGQFIIMTDFYADWLARSNFGTIFYPGSANETNATIAQWHLNEMPGITVHELGHCLLSMFHDSSCDNVMHVSGAYRTHLAPYQLNGLHRFLMTTNNHNFIDCDDLTNTTCDLIIDHDVTINEPMVVFGDLIVQEGVTLTVTTDMYFAPTSSIDLERNAKLVVENSLLSNYCDEKWQGIQVTGGNYDFDVRLVNSTVENVSTAISTKPPLPWPEATAYGNGIVQAENVDFINVGRVAELVAYQPSINTSYFRGCTVDGAILGISNWNCIGVEVSDNEFLNVDKYCLLAETGSFDADNNDFSSGIQDVYIANTLAGFSSTIIDNNFNGEGIGVKMLGTSFGPSLIESNTFNTPFFNIWMEGDNHYIIRKNDINGVWGAICASTGDIPNLIEANAFNNFSSGINTGDNNAGLNFVENCFSTGIIDVSIYGSVSPIIGTLEGAANNCFTHQGFSSSTVIDMGGNPDPFTYYWPINVQLYRCLVPVSAHNNITLDLLGEPINACELAGDNLVSNNGNSYCDPDNTISAHSAAISWLNNSMAFELNNMPQGGINPQAIQYQHCLARIQRQLVNLYLAEGDYTAARAVLANDTTEDAKILTYSTYVYENDLAGAKSYLNTQGSVSNAFADFIDVQLIQLERLHQGRNFSANPQQLTDLYNIAVKTHPYATYAKALYFHLTDIELSSTINLPQANQALQGQNTLTTSPESVGVYPNPASSQVYISLPEEILSSVQIADISGRIVHQEDRATASYALDTSKWKRGVYSIIILEGQELVYRTKLVIQ